MPRYFFHKHESGQKTEDLLGKLFATDAIACHRANAANPG